MTIERFIIVYDADAGLWGELRYFAGKLSGTSECSACSITHNTLSEKKSWQACKAGLGVPVDQLHRNELSPPMREVIASRYPCVLAQSAATFRYVLGPEDLQKMAGSEQLFAEALRETIATSAPA